VRLRWLYVFLVLSDAVLVVVLVLYSPLSPVVAVAVILSRLVVDLYIVRLLRAKGEKER
jgi:hypothetical protein